MNKKYRFDNCYELVYKYSEANKCYYCIGSYYMYDITKDMGYKRAVRRVNEYSTLHEGSIYNGI